jgi:hypothetical protein
MSVDDFCFRSAHNSTPVDSSAPPVAGWYSADLYCDAYCCSFSALYSRVVQARSGSLAAGLGDSANSAQTQLHQPSHPASSRRVPPAPCIRVGVASSFQLVNSTEPRALITSGDQDRPHPYPPAPAVPSTAQNSPANRDLPSPKYPASFPHSLHLH